MHVDKLPKPIIKDFITTKTAKIILKRRALKRNGKRSIENRQRYPGLSRQVNYQKIMIITLTRLEIEQHSLKKESRYL